MQTTYRRIAVKFNRRNRAEFDTLARENRLTHVSFCTPTGRIEPHTVQSARAIIASGRNVYADVAEVAAQRDDTAAVASYVADGLGEW
jgi:hypothetical protein